MAVTLLQYVDDILLGTQTEPDCVQHTIDPLNFLGAAGYGVSQKAAQVVQQTVVCLGFTVTQGERSLGMGRKEAICPIPEPNSKQELRAFLGMAGWCCLWIIDFGLLAPRTAKPGKTFGVICLRETPYCFGSTDSEDRILEKTGRISFQAAGPSKSRLASCLRPVAATVTLLQEARKLTLGQKLVVQVPHAAATVLEQKGGHWLSPRRMRKYQAILLEQDDVELKVTSVLNPATLLPLASETELERDGLVTIEQVYSSRADLKDEPIDSAEMNLFVDGSGFVANRTRKAGYAAVLEEEVIAAEALPPGTSAQKAELIALIRALGIAAGKLANIGTDSRCAFRVLHAHGALWKERGLLSAQGTPAK